MTSAFKYALVGFFLAVLVVGIANTLVSHSERTGAVKGSRLEHPLVTFVLAVLAVIGIGVGVVAGAQGGVPLSAADLAMTPRGWVPILDGHALISVPGSWRILYNSPPCIVGSPPGEVLVNALPGIYNCPNEAVDPPWATVWLSGIPSGARYGHRSVINGIAVYPSGEGSYLVPTLGVEIRAVGLFNKRVLDTLYCLRAA
jgi:hypothetical protein